ncbi:MAG: hypothetical protein HY711_08405 [Candidatus Melainabacteria bacterium]|nr:hypothetical protein [Candidatus Melainabacteria bacterium]
MFAWAIKLKAKDKTHELSTSSSQYTLASRRAINLVPIPLDLDAEDIIKTSLVKYHHLLVSTEGKQRTCVLKIISPKKKSRAALVIFRGRVVGCLYGKRDLGGHCLDKEAHARALLDLATPGNILNTYDLPDELIIGCTSLFHGQTLELSEYTLNYSAKQIYDAAIRQVSNLGLPGVVVVSNQDNEMMCMVFLYGGKVYGVYSSQDGWIGSQQNLVAQYLSSTPNARIRASFLATRSLDEVCRIGFSLTGLGDRVFTAAKSTYLNKNTTVESSYNAINAYESQHAQQLSAVHYSRTRRIYSGHYHKHAHSIHP